MPSEYLRYNCQIALPNFNDSTQELLQQAKVLIVGAGGLGCPAAQYLAATGVGTIGIADFDTISISNLHRQILYTPAEIGLKKVVIACNKLQQHNPQITLIPHDVKITSDNVLDLIQQYDIIVDGTDNFDTKYLLNDACVLTHKPLVYGAIYQYEGQVAIWNMLNKDSTRTPHYRDLFPEVDALQVPNCAEGGVIPTLAGIIGCMQANEVIKYITQTGELLAGKLLVFDAQTMQSRIINIGTVTNTPVTELKPTEVVKIISVGDFKQHINDYTLIDIRTIEERTAFNIGGLHIPLSDIETNTSYLNGNKPIIFYCASGKRSAEAVKMVKREHPNAPLFYLDGGIKAWKEAQ
jgi:adenylyltransferase/sulfurtransferase